MSNNKQAIEQLCSYFDREIGEILRLVVKHSDGDSDPSAASGPFYRKLLYITMLDTLAGLCFGKKMSPVFLKRNSARFSRFVIEHCSWSEAELVSLPFLLEKLKEQKLEVRSLGQFVSDKLLRFSTKVSDGVTVVASEMDEHESVLLGHATTEEEKTTISEYKHIALLYRYRNRLVHESRQPGYAMEGSAVHPPVPYYHGYLNDSRWHLGYPLAMFEQLARRGLAGFRSYLEANSIDPYSLLDDTRRW